MPDMHVHQDLDQELVALMLHRQEIGADGRAREAAPDLLGEGDRLEQVTPCLVEPAEAALPFGQRDQQDDLLWLVAEVLQLLPGRAEHLDARGVVAAGNLDPAAVDLPRTDTPPV